MLAQASPLMSLAAHLESWFATRQRAMPWRTNPSPYACLVSEFMLQQTTFDSALNYFTHFMKALPTLEALACASESHVLKLWEGLGYYARARHLRESAQHIQETGWPSCARDWMRLPGVGPYTAAALASVINHEKIPVVDGNVARVFARVWQLSDDFHQLSARQSLVTHLQPEIEHAQNPGNFNQAMMELGALVCRPTQPLCTACPIQNRCQAFQTKTIEQYPAVRARKKIPTRYQHALIMQDHQGRLALIQRTQGNLLKGLWELPDLHEAHHLKQTFSHFHLDLTTYRTASHIQFCDPHQVPLSTATRKVLRACGLLD